MMSAIHCLLALFLLSGYQIIPTNALKVGDKCVTNGALAPNPENESQFFYCMDRIIYLGNCINGRIFDVRTGQCVDPSSSGGAEEKVECFGRDYETIPDSENDSIYYLCVNNKATLMRCAVDTYYNTNRGRCMSRASSICSVEITAVLPDPNGNCHKFLVCLQGDALMQTCPDGEYFNPETTMCEQRIVGSCSALTGKCSDTGRTQPIQNDCYAFNYCDGHTWLTMTCPIGYYYNPTSLYCESTLPKGCKAT